MPKVPSEKTQLATARREIKELRQHLHTSRIDCSAYRQRATKAEQDASEWKARFDALLKYGLPEKNRERLCAPEPFTAIEAEVGAVMIRYGYVDRMKDLDATDTAADVVTDLLEALKPILARIGPNRDGKQLKREP